MASIDTFEWMVAQLWPNPDAEAKRVIEDRRDSLLKIRSEDERQRYVEELFRQLRELKKRKVVS
jgi:hypothetical protein